MTFSEIDYTPEQSEFLVYLESIGVILQTVVLKPVEPISDIYDASRTAALNAMRILATRYEQKFQKINPHLDIKDYFNVRVFEDRELTGKLIDFSCFVGHGYDLDTEILKIYTYGTNHYAIYPKVTEGFVYALLEPPHGIRLLTVRRPKYTSGVEHDTHLKTELFKSYLDTILSVKVIADTKFLSIFSWSTDWSNYFDDGKEWWGEFCWTIYNCKENTFTFIAASTTD